MVYKTVRLAFAVGPPPRAKANKKASKEAIWSTPWRLAPGYFKRKYSRRGFIVLSISSLINGSRRKKGCQNS
jgi:hypothetical protein